MKLLKRYVMEERSEILDNGIRLNAIGQIDRLPPVVRIPLRGLILDSRQNSDMILNLALSYGSRAEITSAFKSLATDVQARRIQLDDVNEQMISDRLFTAGMPDQTCSFEHQESSGSLTFCCGNVRMLRFMSLICLGPISDAHS